MSWPWCCHLAVSWVKPEARGEGSEHSHVTLLSLQNDRNSLVLEETAPKMSFVFHVDLMWQLLPRNVDYNCEQNHSNHQKTVIPGRGLWRENLNESCHKHKEKGVVSQLEFLSHCTFIIDSSATNEINAAAVWNVIVWRNQSTELNLKINYFFSFQSTTILLI